MSQHDSACLPESVWSYGSLRRPNLSDQRHHNNPPCLCITFMTNGWDPERVSAAAAAALTTNKHGRRAVKEQYVELTQVKLTSESISKNDSSYSDMKQKLKTH